MKRKPKEIIFATIETPAGKRERVYYDGRVIERKVR